MPRLTFKQRAALLDYWAGIRYYLRCWRDQLPRREASLAKVSAAMGISSRSLWRAEQDRSTESVSWSVMVKVLRFWYERGQLDDLPEDLMATIGGD